MNKPDRQLTFRVAEDRAGEHLDKLVAHAARVSQRVARTWISAGRVSVSGRCVRILTRPIRGGSEVCITLDDQDRREGRGDQSPASAAASSAKPAGGTRAAPQARAVSVPAASAPAPEFLHVDRYLVVVNKPAGLLSEHDRFGSPSLESVVPAELRRRGERDQIWLVHRLDAGTSGLIVLARTPMAAKVLGEQFRTGKVSKRYLALCRGRFEGEVLVDEPIARAQRTKHEVSPSGKPACTTFIALAANDVASLVRAEPHTGRTHQIRVHLSHLGHPLWGDGLYGGPTYTPRPARTSAPRPASNNDHPRTTPAQERAMLPSTDSLALPEPIGRPMLHAARLVLAHPKTGERLVLVAHPPSDFWALVERLGLQPPDRNQIAD